MEGKYVELENLVYEKLKNLSPTSRVLRKDLPITTKHSLEKSEQLGLDADMDSFIKNIPKNKVKLRKVADDLGLENVPPVRSVAQSTVKISASKLATEPPKPEVRN